MFESPIDHCGSPEVVAAFLATPAARRAVGLKIPRLAETHMPGMGDDQMIMNRDIQAACGIDNLSGESPVSP